MTALLMQTLLLGRLLTAADGSMTTAQPAPPPESVQPQVNKSVQASSPAATDAPASKAPTPIPWKTITKVGSGVAYAVWVGLWTVMLPLGFVGLTLVGLSASQNNSGLLGGGALLIAATVALFLLGAAAAITGAGFGVATTVQQLLHPDEHAVDSTLSMFMPLTLLL